MQRTAWLGDSGTLTKSPRSRQAGAEQRWGLRFMARWSPARDTSWRGRRTCCESGGLPGGAGQVLQTGRCAGARLRQLEERHAGASEGGILGSVTLRLLQVRGQPVHRRDRWLAGTRTHAPILSPPLTHTPSRRGGGGACDYSGCVQWRQTTDLLSLVQLLECFAPCSEGPHAPGSLPGL